MTVPTGRDLNIAARSVRNLLDTVLEEHGVPFDENVALGYLRSHGGREEPAVLAAWLTHGLQIPDAAPLLDRLTAKGLITGEVRLTAAGEARLAAMDPQVKRITAAIWDGIDPDDLAATARVLAEVTRRAEAYAA